MGRISFWMKNSRPVSLPQSLIPGLMAVAMASGTESFSWWLALLAVFGVCMAHLSLNLFDDYFDYKKKESGYRMALAREGIRARTVKCPYLESGEATMGQLLCACLCFGVLAVIPGAVILVFRGWPILVIAFLTAVIGLSYSGGPLSLGYHGLGELVIGVLFGPFLMTGVYLASCGTFSGTVLWMGIAMGMLVCNVVYTHSVLDYEADLRASKRTFAAVLGKKSGQYLFSLILTVCPYLIVAGLCLAGQIEEWYLLVLGTVPWAVCLLVSIGQHLKRPEEFSRPKGWWGPMGSWKTICEAGLDWFMFRWFLARNILTAFGVLVIVSAILS